ncbi:IPT/TIG domain-containing protein [Heliorestis convoluta]|uniref:IPT/TIG domain/Fibronectin type III domain containing protein, putative n=1 Tax=Heliorestis convoluta TaxID=356322 RepID=A0A5Q2MW07_9FIRM|nr:IPT/TIG domain-containing protein [Heliorestis convoluta]QGG46514.1 IPT/TIG domain/Fibronectin type III domain containing protein, putative [Heliorestis convoluta]
MSKITQTKRLTTILLIFFFSASLFPISAFSQDITIKAIFYKAQPRGNPITVDFVGTNLGDINLNEMRLVRGTHSYPLYNTSRENIGGNEFKIRGTVGIDTAIGENEKLDLVLGQTITIPQIFHYRYTNVPNTYFSPSYARPNERQRIDITADAFIRNSGQDPIRNVIITAKDQELHQYSLSQEISHADIDSALQNNPNQAYYWRDGNGIYKISLLSPALPQSSDNIMNIHLKRTMTFQSTEIEEVITIPGDFYIYNPEGQVPQITEITAKPLSDLAIGNQISVQTGAQIEVIVSGEDLYNNQDNWDTIKLLIKGRPFGPIKKPDDKGKIHFAIPANSNLATSYEVVDATLLRDDGALTDPFPITLWADPYHRYRNTLEIIPDSTAGLVEDVQDETPFYWLESGKRQRFKIEAKDIPGFTGANQVFRDLVQNWDTVKDQVQITIGTTKLTILDVQNSHIQVETPGYLPITNELETIIISSPWGRSPVDRKVKVFSAYNEPEIIDVSPRTVSRKVNQFALEVKARNIGPNSTLRLERTINNTLEVLEPSVLAFQAGDESGETILRATFTTDQGNFQKAPSDWNVVVITGAGEVSIQKVEKFKVEKSTNSKGIDQFNVIGGFRFVSAPHFPALHQPGQPISIGVDYLNKLKSTVITPYKVPDKALNQYGGHIITLTGASNFFQFWHEENQTPKLYHPQVLIHWEQAGEDIWVPSTEVFLEHPNDPLQEESLVNQKIHFRLPDLTTAQASFPQDGWVNIAIENLDNQRVIIPKALKIESTLGRIELPDFQITPTAMPDLRGRMASITQGRNLNQVTNLFMGFYPAEQLFINQHDDTMLQFTTTQQTYRDDEYNSNGQRYPRTKPLTLIFADGRAYYDNTKANLTFVEQRLTQPTIEKILPAYSSYNSDHKPTIFIQGENFLSPEVRQGERGTGTRTLQEIWLNNKQVWPPNGENNLTSEEKPQVYRLTKEGITKDYIAFTMPNINFDMPDREIERQLRTDMTLFLIFNDETAYQEKAVSLFRSDERLQLEKIVPLTGPEGFSMPLSIEGKGFRAEGQLPEVYIGGLPATNITVSENGTILSFKTPPLPRGEYKITVANPITKDVLTYKEPYKVKAGQDTGDPQITGVLIDGKASTEAQLRSTGGQRIRIEGAQFVVNENPRQLPELYLQNILIDETYLITPSADAIFEHGVIEFYAPPLDVSRIDRTTEATLLLIRKADARSVSHQLKLMTSSPVITSVAPPGIKVAEPGRTEAIYIYGSDLYEGMTASFYDSTNNLIVQVPQERVIAETFNSDTRPSQAVFRVEFTHEDLEKFQQAYSPNPNRNYIDLRIKNSDGKTTERQKAFILFQEGAVPEILEITTDQPNQYAEPNRASSAGGALTKIRVGNVIPEYYEDKSYWPIFYFGGIPAETLGYEKDNNNLGEAIWQVKVPTYPWPDQAIGEQAWQVDIKVVNTFYLTHSEKEKAFTYTHSYETIRLEKITPNQYQYQQGKIMEATITARPRRPGETNITAGFLKIGDQYPEVYFGSQKAQIVDKNPSQPWPRTELTVIVPQGKVGTVDLRVSNPSGSEGILPQAFTYLQSKPTIETIVPCGIDVEQENHIYLQGKDFQPGLIIRFGEESFEEVLPGNSAYDVTEDPFLVEVGAIERIAFDPITGKEIIKVRVPSLQDLFAERDHLSDSKNITVRLINVDGAKAEAPRKVKLYAGKEGPQIIEVTPNNAFSTGGERVYIKVTNLEIDYRDKRNWPSFAFGGIPVNPNRTNPTLINYPFDTTVDDSQEPIQLLQAGASKDDEWIWAVRVPAYPISSQRQEQTVDLHIINGDCISSSLEQSFTYLRSTGQIDLTTVTPRRSPVEGGIEVLIGARFTLQGDATHPVSPGFVVTEGQVPRVFFGSEEASVINVSRTELRVIAPPHRMANVDIKVINPDGRTYGLLRNAFTYADIPIIESITPASGPQEGAIVVKLKGRGFAPNAKVTFGNAQAEVKELSATEISVILPRGPVIPNDDIKISVDVTVTNQDGEFYRVEKGFTYYKDGGLPEDPPEILARVIDRNTISITWSPVNMAQAYEVEISEGNHHNYRLYEVVPAAKVQNGQFYSLVRALESQTRYAFRVRAISSAGTGPYSEVVFATTNNTRGWEGFGQAETEVLVTAEGATLMFRQGRPDGYYDLRQGLLGAAQNKAVSFSPQSQSYNTSVLLDNDNWKIIVPTQSLRFNAAHMTHSYSTIQVNQASEREAERLLISNGQRRPLTPIYEVKLTYENNNQQRFAPAIYPQPFTLSLRYNNLFNNPSNLSRPHLYWYNHNTRQWIRLESSMDSTAISATINRPGYYALFTD